jgi:HD-like signal output (HDOD) protein
VSLTPDLVEKRVIELTSLPTLPGVLRQIARLTEERDSSAHDVAKLIGTDQVLSAKVLRLINSPMYGFPGRISSVTHAIVLLGFNVIKGLVMGTSVFSTIGAHGRGLWQHSLGCAVLARRLGMMKGLKEPEEIMVAGLLHDLGKVALMYIAPDDYGAAVEAAKSSRRPISTLEEQTFGMSHTQAAAILAHEWHFPERLSSPLVYHHMPSRAKNHAEYAALVHLADILARGMGYGDPGDSTMPPLDADAYRGLGLSLAQIDNALMEAEAEYAAGARAFLYEEL